ncbi:hypothetical protein [Halopseudomonas salegens]|uniref:Uncharacterized protein n=1 Tax=Halopseudomonas salegens TaxID=1434072 RepID=A0A1H2FBB7_9GAMM|nr:hypothetical protein [Halopseudomonas salegens]SDU04686.1 hypothetical protein SAMN05216210_1434 [Halopseudomonas salegens]
MSSAKGRQRRIPTAVKLGFMGLLITMVLVVGWQNLPRGVVSTDLEVIGQGKPVLVLTRDVNFVGGGEVMELMGHLSTEEREQVEMRVAHLGQPKGQAFARQFSTRDADLVLLDGQGEMLGRVDHPETLEHIRHLLQQHL